MRKKIFFTILFLAFAILLFFTVKFLKNYLFQTEESEIPIDGEPDFYSYYLNEKLPTDIIWIGGTCEYPYSIPLREEKEITEETLTIRDGYVKMLIVVDDLDDTVELSDEELALIHKYVTLDNRYSFVYVGKKLEQVCKAFDVDYENTISGEDLSISFFRKTDGVSVLKGLYTTTEVTYERPVYDCVFDDYADFVK